MYTNTKGGWKYRKDVSGRSFYIETVDTNHDKTFIGDIGGGFHTLQEVKDNARLVSAAPDMLEALQNLENDNNSIPKHAWNLVQNAIFKAINEGEK